MCKDKPIFKFKDRESFSFEKCYVNIDYLNHIRDEVCKYKQKEHFVPKKRKLISGQWVDVSSSFIYRECSKKELKKYKHGDLKKENGYVLQLHCCYEVRSRNGFGEWLTWYEHKC